MNTELDRLTTSRRYVFVGPVVALAWMGLTFAHGLVIGSQPLMVAALLFAAVAAVLWHVARVALDRRIAEARQR